MVNPSDANHAGDFHPLITVFLVVIESFLSLLLRLDAAFAHHLLPLIQSNTIIRVYTTAPSMQFFVTLSPRGILLDRELPDQAVAGAEMLLPSFLRLDIWVSNPRLQSHFQISGDVDTVAILYDAFVFLSPRYLLNKWLAIDYVKERSRDFFNRQSAPSAAQITRQHQQEYALQTKQLNQLILNLKEKDYALKKMRIRLRRLTVLLLFLSVLFSITAAYFISH